MERGRTRERGKEIERWRMGKVCETDDRASIKKIVFLTVSSSRTVKVCLCSGSL